MTVADNTLYYFGQRVIINRNEIAVVVRDPDSRRGSDDKVWVRKIDGVVQWYGYANVRPLPNGEL